MNSRHFTRSIVPITSDIFAIGVTVRHVDDEQSLGLITNIADDSTIDVYWVIPWKGVVYMPRMKKVSPGLVPQQLVQIQPMTPPAGLVFYEV